MSAGCKHGMLMEFGCTVCRQERDARDAASWRQLQRHIAHAAIQPIDRIDGDLLPEIGTRVKIHLAREDLWVEHTVVGFYVWGDLKGDRWLQRVFVRVQHDGGSFNARLLHEVRTLEDKPMVDWGRDRMWMHTKSQGVYEKIGLARMQTDQPLNDMDPVIVYEGKNGQLWVRPVTEFDARFEAVKA